MIRYRVVKFFSDFYATVIMGAGRGTFISIRAELKGKNIIIGRKCRILRHAKIDTSSNPSNANYLKQTNVGCLTLGNNVIIKDHALLLTYDGFIKIGDYCSINPYTVIYGHGGVTIGDNVMIAASCVIVSSNHNFESIELPISKQGITSQGIHIESDVWIGSNVKILDGVTVGKGCVVASGAVVNKSLEPFGVYAGVPAKLVKWRNRNKT